MNWIHDKQMKGHKWFEKWPAEVKFKHEPQEDGTQKMVITSATKKGKEPKDKVLLDPALVDNLNKLEMGAGYHYFPVEEAPE